MPGENSVRAAVDIGGTFSDFQFHDAKRNRVVSYKTPTTPSDPSEGLLTGLQEGAEKHGFALEDIGLIMHGSTIATNAVLERKLPTGALLTTAGFEDVLEIGRHIRKDVYALKAEERSVLVPRHLRFGIPERIRADGSVETVLNEDAIRSLVPRLLEAGVETVAISFLHAYQNGTHEQRAAELIAEIAPQLSVATSSVSSPEIREYERTSTTVLNALLKPVISGYLERVKSRLEGAGITAPLYMVQSNGGVARPEEAARMPVKLLLSGPAGGAMAVAELAKRYQIDDLVGLDMGGTSSDVCVVHGGEVGETAESDIDGLPVRLPMIEIRTIGAGGGSLAGVETGALRVGPKSAGAMPGPACYGRGGTHPTVTDANVVLGRISPDAFMGGGMALDVESAQTAVATHVSTPLSLTSETSAAGIVDVANTHMAGAIRLSLFEKGADPADFTLVPFGGAAGLHACAVADELDINEIVFPADASTLSARGILGADLRRDLSFSDLMIAEPSNLDRIAEALAKLETDARALLADDGLATERHQLTFAGDLRYRGQAYEITTPWPGLAQVGDLDRDALDRLITAFHTAHQTRFSHSAPGEAVELVTLRVVAVGLLDQPDLSALAPTQTESNESTQHRRLVMDDTWTEVPAYQRDALQTRREPITGPAVIEETYTVIFIDAGWQVSPATGGDLKATRLGVSS